MPSEDIVINGIYSANVYQLIYIVDGETYEIQSISYGEEIIPIEPPIKEGYVFSGWSAIPETMPANIVVVIGNFVVDKGDIVLDDLKAYTERSQVNVPSFIIDGEDWLEYKDYINKVDMRGRVVNSTLSSYDLGFFAPGTRNWDIKIYDVDGSFNGVVSDFTAVVEQAKVGENTVVEADVYVLGQPNWRESEYNVDVKSLYTSASDVEMLVKHVTGKSLNSKALEIVRNLRSVDLSGMFGGKLYSFRTKG
jgi:hypothetical protein